MIDVLEIIEEHRQNQQIDHNEPANTDAEQRAAIGDLKLIKQFVLAGNATFTIQNSKTGKHFTYEVNKPNDDTPYFVRVGVGYQESLYMGIIRDVNI